jgi:hypothetical protein
MSILEKLKDFKQFLEDFETESQEIEIEDFRQLYSEIPEENRLHVKKYRDALYIGELNEKGKREGKGIMLYADGRKYEGNWLSDLREGRGYEKHRNGNLYLGTFFNGKAHGHGIYKWANGE